MSDTDSPIIHIVDHAKRRLIKRVRGDMAARKVIDEFVAYYREHPETLFYDVVIDFLDYFGDTAWQQIEEFLPVYSDMVASSPYKPSESETRWRRTAVVSDDPMYEMLFRLVAQLFPKVEFKVFKTEAAAHAWLDLKEES